MGNLQKCSLFIHQATVGHVLVYHPEFFHLSWQQHTQAEDKKDNCTNYFHYEM